MQREDEKIVVPNCCEAVQRSSGVYLVVPDSFYDGETDVKPDWIIHIQFNVRMRLELSEFNDRTLRGLEAGKKPNWSHVSFCPYCGKKLPDIEFAPIPGVRYTKTTDGGYYCDTCKERLHACQCMPPERQWRIKG